MLVLRKDKNLFGNRANIIDLFTMPTTEIAHHIGKLPRRVSGYVGWRLAFKVYPKALRNSHRQMVQLMYEGVLELLPAGGGADEYDCPLPIGVAVSEAAVILASVHKVFGLLYDVLRGISLVKTIEHGLLVIAVLRKEEVYIPTANREYPVYHQITSSQGMSMPRAIVFT